jgi:phosphonate transport system ATP-binding protein
LAAVDDVTLAVPSGQMVGIIGRSGAGKSTLLRLINRLVEPTEGRIAFGDIDVVALRGRALLDWRGRCAMIFQSFNLVSRLDVLTNVLLGLTNRRSSAQTVLKWFRDDERRAALTALDHLDLLPQALQRAETLSGGQQQRVAIARAMLQQPDVLLADEPIASLDPHNAKVVMDELRAFSAQRGVTVICNMHAVDTARAYCDRIVGMARGRVVFDGRPAELSRSAVRAVYGSDGEDPSSDEVEQPILPRRRAAG